MISDLIIYLRGHVYPRKEPIWLDKSERDLICKGLEKLSDNKVQG